MKKRKRTRIYVGYTKKPHYTRTIVRAKCTTVADFEQAQSNYGHPFYAFIGPFRTLAGAQFCADYKGASYQTVAEFEYAAKTTN